MSEDFDYIPFKYDWHKNKNTLRYKHFHYLSSKNNLLECHRNLNKEEIPVTIIDEYFDDNFINSTNVYSTYQSKPLNKDFLWTNVEKSLEETSIQTIKKWSPEYGVVCRTFNVPVKNYILKDNTLQKELTWLKWNNQYYDPNYLYTFIGNDDDTSGVLKKICPLKWSEPEIENMESTGRKTFTQKNKKNKLVQTNECYYQIDLGDPKHIQTIVTFGKYPNKRAFPRRKYNAYGYYCDTNKPYVNVVEVVNDDSYVTNYSVAYKDSQTQKWVHYNEFEGNINSYTAKINPVDIYSRYIRIKPLKFVKTKSMIIYVYVSKNTNKNEYESEDEEVVSYTLVPSNNKQIRYDGYGETRYSPDYFYAQYNKNLRKRYNKYLIEEELNAIDDFNNCSVYKCPKV
jgi:hypothetical protein